MSIDFSKPVRTKNTHEPVTIFMQDYRGPIPGKYPILGVLHGEDTDVVFRCDAQGNSQAIEIPLENVPEERFYVVYADGTTGFGYKSRNLALLEMKRSHDKKLVVGLLVYNADRPVRVEQIGSPLTPSLDFGRPIMTVVGQKVRILDRDLKGTSFPIVAAVRVSENHDEVRFYNEKGVCADGYFSNLRNASYWINLYPAGPAHMSWDSEESAKQTSDREFFLGTLEVAFDGTLTLRPVE